MSNFDVYQTCLKELKETQVERSLILTNHWSNGPALCDARTQKTRMDKWFCTWQKITWRQELWQSVSLLDFWAWLMSSGNYESISLYYWNQIAKNRFQRAWKYMSLWWKGGCAQCLKSAVKDRDTGMFFTARAWGNLTVETSYSSLRTFLLKLLNSNCNTFAFYN